MLQRDGDMSHAVVLQHPYHDGGCSHWEWQKYLGQRTVGPEKHHDCPSSPKNPVVLSKMATFVHGVKHLLPNMEFIQGIPPDMKREDFLDTTTSLFVLDDLMKDATESADVCELFTEGSHHRSLV